MSASTIDHAMWECGTCESAAVAVATAMAKLNMDPENPEHTAELRECGADLRRARRALVVAVAASTPEDVAEYLRQFDAEEARRKARARQRHRRWEVKQRNYFVAGPCPVCGKPDAARMGSTSWGHDAMCCSERCGFMYATSTIRSDAEVDRLNAVIEDARSRLRDIRRETKKAPMAVWAYAGGHVRRARYREREALDRLERTPPRWMRERDPLIARDDYRTATEAWAEAVVSVLASLPPVQPERALQCSCTYEAGDSSCEVHPTCMGCGEPWATKDGTHCGHCLVGHRDPPAQGKKPEGGP